MQLLKHAFIFLQCIGLWRPVHWTPGWKTMLYNAYTSFMMYLLVTVTFSELIALLSALDDAKEFANNSFLLLSMIAVCGKSMTILVNRGKIIELVNMLQQDPCRPKTKEEFAIQNEFEEIIRFNTLWYAVLTGSAAFSITVRSLVVDIPRRNLSFKAWLPFRLDPFAITFWYFYFHQLFAHVAGAFVNIAFDTFVPGLIVQTCAQIQILKYRLNNIPQTVKVRRKFCQNEYDQGCRRESQILESESLSDCIRHHIKIFKFAEITNNIFSHVVFLQYFISSVVLCVSVYELSKMTLFSAEFTAIILYLACMLVQLFNFCFYSGEMTLQSLEICDAVYQIDWSSFSLRTKKSLVTIMIRSLRPLTFTCANIIMLSLDSFNAVIKLSYSGYNVLQQSTE